MIRVLKFILVGLIVISSCATKRQVEFADANSLNIHFIDDFEDNIVSLYVNDNLILDKSIFRRSDAPQLRSIKPKHIILDSDGAKIYNKGQLEKLVNHCCPIKE